MYFIRYELGKKERDKQTMGIMDMMNKTKVQRIEMIHCNQIERNPLNTYPIKQIDELSELILTDGQKEPCQVYEIEQGKYRLISGERRWTAIMSLFDRGKHDGMIQCIVREAFKDEYDELEEIFMFNSFRELEDSDMLELVSTLSDLYDEQKNKGKKLGKKREWIGNHLHRSGRTIDKYMNKLRGAENASNEDDNNTNATNKAEKKQHPEPVKALRSCLNKIEKEIEKYPLDDESIEVRVLRFIADDLTKAIADCM